MKEYKKYILFLRDSLITSGLKIPKTKLNTSQDIYELSNAIDSILWFYSILETSNSRSKLHGFPFKIGKTYAEACEELYSEQIREELKLEKEESLDGYEEKWRNSEKEKENEIESFEDNLEDFWTKEEDNYKNEEEVVSSEQEDIKESEVQEENNWQEPYEEETWTDDEDIEDEEEPEPWVEESYTEENVTEDEEEDKPWAVDSSIDTEGEDVWIDSDGGVWQDKKEVPKKPDIKPKKGEDWGIPSEMFNPEYSFKKDKNNQKEVEIEGNFVEPIGEDELGFYIYENTNSMEDFGETTQELEEELFNGWDNKDSDDEEDFEEVENEEESNISNENKPIVSEEELNQELFENWEESSEDDEEEESYEEEIKNVSESETEKEMEEELFDNWNNFDEDEEDEEIIEEDTESKIETDGLFDDWESELSSNDLKDKEKVDLDEEVSENKEVKKKNLPKKARIVERYLNEGDAIDKNIKEVKKKIVKSAKKVIDKGKEKEKQESRERKEIKEKNKTFKK